MDIDKVATTCPKEICQGVSEISVIKSTGLDSIPA